MRMSTVLIPALSHSTPSPLQQLIFYRKFVAMVKQPQIYHADENYGWCAKFFPNGEQKVFYGDDCWK